MFYSLGAADLCVAVFLPEGPDRVSLAGLQSALPFTRLFDTALAL